MINLSKFLPFFIPNVYRACSFFTNLDLFFIDNAHVIYGKIRYILLLWLKYLNSLLIVIAVTNAKISRRKHNVANIPSHAIRSWKCVTEIRHLTATYTAGRSPLHSTAHTNMRTETDWTGLDSEQIALQPLRRIWAFACLYLVTPLADNLSTTRI